MSKRNDSEFFEAVVRHDALFKAMCRMDVRAWCPSVGEQPHNSVLKLWRPSWLIELPDEYGIRGVNTHYEARVPHEFRVESEIDPYIPSLDKNSVRERQLTRQLALKARVLAKLRAGLLTPHLTGNLGATARSQPPTNETATQCAVKFSGMLTRSPDVAAAAEYYARIIVAVTPIIDTIITEIRAESADVR